MNKTLKSVIKYAIIAAVGVLLFEVASRAALTERPAGGIGGEIVLLGLPLIWWITEQTFKDLIGDYKREWAEIKAERAAESSGDYDEKAKNNARVR